MVDHFEKIPAASHSIGSLGSIGSMAAMPVLPAGGEIIRVCS